jgi:hypothetical protein
VAVEISYSEALAGSAAGPGAPESYPSPASVRTEGCGPGHRRPPDFTIVQITDHASILIGVHPTKDSPALFGEPSSARSRGSIDVLVELWCLVKVAIRSAKALHEVLDHLRGDRPTLRVVIMSGTRASRTRATLSGSSARLPATVSAAGVVAS